jgi:trimethylamine--corrinoid protein Co-methyltransferase
MEGITFDLAQLVIDNEIVAMIKNAVNGIAVNDETLSVDIIKEIGIGKDYLAHESTYNYMKSTSQSKLSIGGCAKIGRRQVRKIYTNAPGKK